MTDVEAATWYRLSTTERARLIRRAGREARDLRDYLV